MKNTNSFFKKTMALFLSIVFAISSFAVTGFSTITALADEDEYYFMTYFTGNNRTSDGSNIWNDPEPTMTQATRFAVSDDGINFSALDKNRPTIIQQGGTQNSRDHFCFKGQDGWYYIIATDQDYSDNNWGKLCSTFVLWRSRDLINWQDETIIDIHNAAGMSGATINYAWAPEVIWDSKAGKYMIYFALKDDLHTEHDYGYGCQMMYYIYASDLLDVSTWEEPKCLIERNKAAIDGNITYSPTDDMYYMFYKDESAATVALAKSDKVNGPYNYVGKLDSSEATGGIEGCQVYKKGNDYYLFADRYGAAGRFVIYNLGSDLSEITATEQVISVTDGNPISTVEELNGFENLSPRHGSIIHINKAQYKALLEAYTGSTTGDIRYDFSRKAEKSGWTWDSYRDTSNHTVVLNSRNQSGSSINIPAGGGYASISGSWLCIDGDQEVHDMFTDDVYTVDFNFTLDNANTSGGTVFALGTNTYDCLYLNGNGEFYYRASGSSSDTKMGTTSIKEGINYHFTIVSDGTTITLYKNGKKVCSAAATVDFPTSGTRIAGFGYSDTHNTCVTGTYYDVRFRNFAIGKGTVETEYKPNLAYRYNEGTATYGGRNNISNVSSKVRLPDYEGATNCHDVTISCMYNAGDNIGSGDGNPIFEVGAGGTGNDKTYLNLTDTGYIWYCWGDGTTNHYFDVKQNTLGSLSTNTWYHITVVIHWDEINARYLIKVFKNGEQTYSGTYEVTNYNSNYTVDKYFSESHQVWAGGGNSYWNNDGNAYIDDLRIYGSKNIDPEDLYAEYQEEYEAEQYAEAADEARTYVRANLENFNVESLSYRNAYHNGHVATGGFNNVVASATGFACNDVWSNSTKYSDIHYAVFYPTDIVLSYDGVNTPALPCQLEMHCYGDNKNLATIYCSDGGYGDSHRNANFRLAHYWTGYITDYTAWAGDTYAYNHADYPINDNGKAEVEADGNYHIGYYAGWQWDYNFAVPRGEGTGSFFWNKLNYTGTVNTTTYKETHTTTPMKGYMGGDFSIVDCTHNVYVLNYKPIYDILKSSSPTAVPNTDSNHGLKFYYANVIKDNESEYTEDSLNQFYVAAYKVLKANPMEYSEATYQSNFSGTVDLAAANIKEAVEEFGKINLVKKADFSALETAYSDAQDIVDNSADDYTASSIEALQEAMDDAEFYINCNADTRANMSEDDYQEDIDNKEAAIIVAKNALVAKISVTYDRYSGDDVVVKFEPGASASEVEAAAPELPANNFADGKHYSYSWDKDFAAVTAAVTYSQVRNEVAHSYTYTHIDQSDPSQHTVSCSVNGQSHSEDVDCSFKGVYTPASGNANGYTTYTCDDCGYAYIDYDVQDWTEYDAAVAEYNSTKDSAAYTTDSKLVYQTAVEALLLDKTDKTISGEAIGNVITAITNAKSSLDEVADLSELDAAYAKADALLTDLVGKAPVYTQASVQALVDAMNAENVSTYVNADADTRANYGQAVEAAANDLADDINDAYDALETASSTPDPEVADEIEVYEEAVQKVTKLDPDAYIHTDSIDAAISTANSLVGSDGGVDYGDDTINTIKDNATADNYDGATYVLLTALANSIRTYTVTTEGVNTTGFNNGTASGEDSPYTATYGTEVLCTAVNDTAWFLEITTGTMKKDLAFQGYGSVLRTKVVGNTKIVAVKKTEGTSRIRIIRAYGDEFDTSADYTDVTKNPLNYSDYVETGSAFTLQTARAIAYCTFMGYYTTDGTQITDASITISEDTDIIALYKNTSAECAINATDIGGALIGDTYYYNDKVELDGGSGTFAWIEKVDETHYRPFFIGQKFTFYASESAELKAVSEEDYFDTYHFSTTPDVILRKAGVINSGSKAIFNGQVVTPSMDSVEEYGVLIGKAKAGGSITADNLVIENSGTQDGYSILRAKSTKLIGDANQFGIGVNGLAAAGDYIYRGYLIYNDGSTLRTVYTDVVTVD